MDEGVPPRQLPTFSLDKLVEEDFEIVRVAEFDIVCDPPARDDEPRKRLREIPPEEWPKSRADLIPDEAWDQVHRVSGDARFSLPSPHHHRKPVAPMIAVHRGCKTGISMHGMPRWPSAR